MAGQLEEPQNANDAEEVENVGVGELSTGGQRLQDQVRVEGERGHSVNHIDGVARKVQLVGRYLCASQSAVQWTMKR